MNQELKQLMHAERKLQFVKLLTFLYISLMGLTFIWLVKGLRSGNELPAVLSALTSLAGPLILLFQFMSGRASVDHKRIEKLEEIKRSIALRLDLPKDTSTRELIQQLEKLDKSMAAMRRRLDAND